MQVLKDNIIEPKKIMKEQSKKIKNKYISKNNSFYQIKNPSRKQWEVC